MLKILLLPGAVTRGRSAHHRIDRSGRTVVVHRAPGWLVACAVRRALAPCNDLTTGGRLKTARPCRRAIGLQCKAGFCVVTIQDYSTAYGVQTPKCGPDARPAPACRSWDHRSRALFSLCDLDLRPWRTPRAMDRKLCQHRPHAGELGTEPPATEARFEVRKELRIDWLRRHARRIDTAGSHAHASSPGLSLGPSDIRLLGEHRTDRGTTPDLWWWGDALGPPATKNRTCSPRLHRDGMKLTRLGGVTSLRVGVKLRKGTSPPIDTCKRIAHTI